MVTDDLKVSHSMVSFSLEVLKQELTSFVDKFNISGKAALFCEAVLSNDFKLCKLFETSNSRRLKIQEKGEDHINVSRLHCKLHY